MLKLSKTQEECMSHTLTDKAVSLMLELLAIDSPSCHEEHARIDLESRLKELCSTVQIDEKGNLLGRIGATAGHQESPTVLLCCHMDTVPSAVGVKPSIADGILRSDGTTALGADDKAGIAAILVALEHVVSRGMPHGPITVLFTVEEEIGLEGIKALDLAWLGPVDRGYILDARGPVGTAITSAPSKSDAKIIFHGKASHAGFAPEKGISAISLAARAIDRMKLLRIDEVTTANIGTIHGGEVTNVVCDRCEVALEVRSSTRERVNRHLAHMEFCCIKAVNDFGGSYEFLPIELYPGYMIDPSAKELTEFAGICKRICIEYRTAPTGGGSDTNILRIKGLPVITLGIGYEGAHTLGEELAIEQLGTLVRLVTALVESEENIT